MTDDNQTQSWRGSFFNEPKRFTNFVYDGYNKLGSSLNKSSDETENQETWKTLFVSGLTGIGGYVKGNSVKEVLTAADGFMKGSKVFYLLQGQYLNVKTTAAFQVNVYLAGTNKWLFRLDKPHPNALFNHFNINPSCYKQLKKDPHFHLPPGSRHVGYGFTKMAQAYNKFNEVMVPIALAVDAAKVAAAASKDYDNKTTRNTVEAAVQVTSGWTGGYLGGTTGAFVGTLLLPGPGTFLFGLGGAVAGGIGLSLQADSFVRKVADIYNYDIVIKDCLICQEAIRINKYKNEEDKTFCDSCFTPKAKL